MSLKVSVHEIDQAQVDDHFVGVAIVPQLTKGSDRRSGDDDCRDDGRNRGRPAGIQQCLPA